MNHTLKITEEEDMDYLLYDEDDVYEAIEIAYNNGDISEFEYDFLITFLGLKTLELQGNDVFENLYYHILNL